MSTDLTSPMQERMYRDMMEAINKRVEEAREVIIKDAMIEFEKNIRAVAGQIAIQVSDYFSIERAVMGKDMVITVRILAEKPPKNEPRT